MADIEAIGVLNQLVRAREDANLLLDPTDPASETFIRAGTLTLASVAVVRARPELWEKAVRFVE